MGEFGAERIRDEAILVARVLLVLLFLVFGFDKVANFSATAAYMAKLGAPLPLLSTFVATFVETVVALAIAVGALTRPLALLMAVYTLGTGLIGHPFWGEDGAQRYGDAINFYKNISIIGGCLLLYVTGPGRFSVDTLLSTRR